VRIIVGGRIAPEGSLDELRMLVRAKELAEVVVEQEGVVLRTRAQALGLEMRE
jgi:hypothetical protein